MTLAPDRVFEPGTGSHRARGSRAATSLGDDPHRPREGSSKRDGADPSAIALDPSRGRAGVPVASGIVAARDPRARCEPAEAPTPALSGVAVPRPAWKLEAIAGRLAEVSAGAAGAPLTAAFRLVLEAQRRREPVAWIGRKESPFFPPDVAEAGIDLAALPVVWAPDATAAAGAADLLVRSGAFGLVVIDLGARESFPIPVQARLAGLARQHGAAVVCLTEKEDGRASMGSLVAVRAHAARAGREKDRYRCETRVLKDKGGRPGGRHAEVCRGPDGLH